MEVVTAKQTTHRYVCTLRTQIRLWCVDAQLRDCPCSLERIAPDPCSHTPPPLAESQTAEQSQRKDVFRRAPSTQTNTKRGKRAHTHDEQQSLQTQLLAISPRTRRTRSPSAPNTNTATPKRKRQLQPRPTTAVRTHAKSQAERPFAIQYKQKLKGLLLPSTRFNRDDKTADTRGFTTTAAGFLLFMHQPASVRETRPLRENDRGPSLVTSPFDRRLSSAPHPSLIAAFPFRCYYAARRRSKKTHTPRLFLLRSWCLPINATRREPAARRGTIARTRQRL